MKSFEYKNGIIWLSLTIICLLGWGNSALAQTWCQQLGENIYRGLPPAQYTCPPPNWDPWIYSPTYSLKGSISSSMGEVVADMNAWLTQYYKNAECGFSLGGFSEFIGNDHYQNSFATVTPSGCTRTTNSPYTVFVTRTRSGTCDTGYMTSAPDGATICLVRTEEPPTVVAIDPGHGLSCAAIGQAVGAVGVTDFPSTNPPAGRLQEDELTVAIALELEKILLAPKYKVVLTKRDVTSCPTLKDRGKIANINKAKAFVSIHINTGESFGSLFTSGTSALFHPSKPTSQPLANHMSFSVANHLGVNNRGAKADIEKAVIKPTVTQMPAVILEAARLSGDDEIALHAKGSTAKVAVGIRLSLDAFFNK